MTEEKDDPRVKLIVELIEAIVGKIGTGTTQAIFDLTQRAAPTGPVGLGERHSYAAGYFDGLRAAVTVADENVRRFTDAAVEGVRAAGVAAYRERV
jgi:hypothetical protein